MLLTIGTILIAGCTSPASSGNQTNNVSVNFTTFTSAATPLQTQCPSSGNVTPWIIINPIGNHVIGDVFEINGTTNIGVNNSITIDIYQSHFTLTDKNFSYKYTSLWNNITVQSNHCGINTWSFTANISGFNPETYFAEVTSVNLLVKNRSIFKVLNASSSLSPMETIIKSPIMQGE